MLQCKKGANMERLIESCLNKNGYVGLSRLGKKAVIKNDYKGRAVLTFDGKKYFFKPSSTSGGANFRNKELFESFISKLIKRHMPTVEYHPAIFRGQMGVVSEHWDEIGKGYMPMSKALMKKDRRDCLDIDSVEDFEGEYYGYWSDESEHKDLKRICSADCLRTLRKAPIQLMAGNYDFKLSNVAVQYCKGQKLKNLLPFDYGFNFYNLVHTYLTELKLPLTKENVAYAINCLIEEYFDIPLAFGATKNCSNYDNLDDFLYDFYVYACSNIPFRKNLKEALTLADEVGDVTKEMEFYGLKFSNYRKELIKRVMEFWQDQYKNILK